MDRTAEIQQGYDAIVAEMKRIGFWDIVEPTPDAYENMGAFGMNTMAFAQWLRYIFIPTIGERLASGGPWPSSSSVGAHAIREFDGQHETGDLVTLLIRFDDLF